jgi:hypothetical protein
MHRAVEARGRLSANSRRGARASLFIPRSFEAAFVRGDLHVHLELEATAALAEVYEAAGSVLPQHITGDAVVKKITVTGDRFSSVTADEFARIPLKTWTRFAVAAAAETADEIKRLHGLAGATVAEWREKRVSFAELARRPVGRPRLEHGFTYYGDVISLDEVLEVGKSGGSKPVKTIQEHFGKTGFLVPQCTAQRWWTRARTMTPS